MINNYTKLNASTITGFKKQKGVAGETPPANRTKASNSWLMSLMLLVLLLVGDVAFSQVNYSQDFTNDEGGWTGDFFQYANETACGGSGGAVRRNLYSFSVTGEFNSPSLGIADGTTEQTLSYDYKVADWSANTDGTPSDFGSFVVQWSNFSAGPWNDLQTVDGSNHVVSGQCANKTVTFTPTAGDLYVRIVATWGNGDYYLNFDNISVGAVLTTPPACSIALSPANGASNVYLNPTLSWAAVLGATSYDVYYGTTSPAAFVTNVTGATLAVSNLTANSSYFYKVVPKNAIGAALGCVEQSFTTGAVINYCLPQILYGCGDGDVIARVTLNTLDNDSGTGCPSDPEPGNQGSGANGNGYSDYRDNPALTTTLQAGSSYGCTVYAGQYAEGYAAWIDYNNDGQFDTSERIGFSSGTVSGSGTAGVLGDSETFPIVLSCNPPLGQHTLRIRAMFATSGSSVTPCENNSYGEVEDYLITISAADPCPTPTTLAAVDINSTSANLTWAVGCAETNWEIAVQAPGAGTPTVGVPVSTTSTFAATGLSVETSYEFYVRAVCTPGSLYSNWAGPYVFTTLPNLPGCGTNVSPANGATNISVASGSVQLTWLAPAATLTEGAATSYEIYSGTTSGELFFYSTETSTTATLSNVGYNQTVFWRIVPINLSGAAVGPCTEFSFTTEMPPANDFCAGAFSLDTLTSPISGSTIGLANNYLPSCGSSFSTTSPDSFYSITVPNGYTLSINNTECNYDNANSLFYGSCDSQNFISCFDDNFEVQTWTNTTGSTQTAYWVQDGWGSGSGTFTLAWTLTPPPVTVTDFLPVSTCGTAGGTVVTVYGTNFLGATAVEFNGIASTNFTVVNDTQITATLPAGNTAGSVRVYKSPSATGYGDSATSFVINSFDSAGTISSTSASYALCMPSTLDLNSTAPGGTWSVATGNEFASINANGIVSGISEGTATVRYSVTSLAGCVTFVEQNIIVRNPVLVTFFTASQISVPVSAGGTGTATFSVVATGTGLTYQWYANDGLDDYMLNASGTGYGDSYTGYDSATLNISGITTDMNGFEYYCVVTGTSPCTPVTTSPNSTLTVATTGIAQDPQSVFVCGSGTTTFTVVKSGTDPIVTYAWVYQLPNTSAWLPLANGFSSATGLTFADADTATLAVSGITVANNGYKFKVNITGPNNIATSQAALLTVNTPLSGISVVSNPLNASNCFTGGSTTFTVSTSIGTVESIQWQSSLTGLAGSWSNVANGSGFTYTGATSASLGVATTSAVLPSGTYFYKALISGVNGCSVALESSSVQLFINNPTVSAPVAATVLAGNSTTFSVTSAAQAATYQWERSANGTSGWSAVVNLTPATVTYSNATSNTLTVTTTGATTPSTANYYRCVVTSNGNCTVASSGAQLSIIAYCNSVPTSNDASGITTAVLSSTTFTIPDVTYSNNTAATPVIFTQGTNANVQITFGTGYTYNTHVWIDFNNDADFFDAGELVKSGESLSTNPTTLNMSFLMPATAALGQHRMRIGSADSGQFSPNPCFSGSFGVTLDFTVNIIPQPACTGAPVAGTVSASPASICFSGTSTLTVAGYTTGVVGISLQWYNSAGIIAGATNATYTTPSLSSGSESYYCKVTCSNSGVSTDTLPITVNVVAPAVTGTNNGLPTAERCGTGKVTLTATGSAGSVLNWYTAATGGTQLFTGATFQTADLSATTPYWVEAATPVTPSPVMTYCASTSTSTSYYITSFSTTGGARNISNTGTVQSPSGYGNFTSLVAGQAAGSSINFSIIPFGTFNTYGFSIFVDWNNDGDFDDAGEKVYGTTSYQNNATGSFTVPATANSGTYRMRVKADYFSTTPTACSSPSGETEDYTFEVSGCRSAARTQVTAIVIPAPALAISSSASTICAGQSTSAVNVTPATVGNYTNYSWSPADTVSGTSGTGFVFTPATTTTYTLTATEVGGCINTATYTVTVNPIPTAPVVSVNSPICQGGTLNFTSSSTSPLTPFQQGFENGATFPLNGWTVSNGTFNNWFIGSNAGVQSGTNAAFVGTNNVATGNSSVNHFYKDIAIPVGMTNINLAFYLKMAIIDNTYDFVKVYTTSTSNTPVVGTLPTTGYSPVFSYTTPALANYTLQTVSLPNSLAGTTVRLVFSYKSDGVSPYAAPAIDAITLTGSALPSFAWSGPNGFSSEVQNPSIASAIPAASGVYTVEATNSFNCKTSTSISAVVHPTPTAVAPANQAYYSGFVSAPISLVGTPSGVTFDITGGLAAGLADQFGVTTIPSFTATGATVVVTITPKANGCIGLPVTYQISPIPVVVSIASNVCGSINNGLNNQINCTPVSIPGYITSGYQFEVTNTSTGEVSTVFSSQHHFKLTDADNYAYGTTFTIRVAAVLNGQVQGYFGSTCTLRTKSVGTTKVIASQCGSTLASISATINANVVSSTNMYRFRVALASPTPTYYYIELPVPNFKLTDVVGLPIMYDTEYLVDAQVRVKLAGFEAWSQYGAVCSIWTPLAPTSSLVECGEFEYVVPTMTTPVMAVAVSNATSYRFRLIGYDTNSDVDYDVTYTNTSPSFTLNNFAGITPGKTYYVSVSIQLYGSFTPYGKECAIIATMPAREIVVEPTTVVESFKATAYPNPFAANFMIDVRTSSESVIAIKVYDMVGRLVEQRSVSVTDLETATIGDRYPSGVYNVVVTQDETVQTVRVVKR